MNNKKNYNTFCENLYSFRQYNKGYDNSSEILRMKNFLKKAMQSDLSPKQKICIKRYFVDNMKMKDIAAELNISSSAVSRHVKRGIENLKKRSVYY